MIDSILEEMFTTEIDDGASVPAIAIQTLAIVAGSAMIGLVSVWIPMALDQLNSWVATISEAIFLVVTAALLPYLVARKLASRKPSAISSGKYVGTVPGLLLLILLLRTRGGILAPHARGAAAIVWIAYAFGIYPLFGCVGYSLGVSSVSRKRIRQ